MTQELIETLLWLSDYDNNDFVFCANTCTQAADTIQYLLDGADEVNKELQEQIEENERLKAENVRLKAERDAIFSDLKSVSEESPDSCHLCKNLPCAEKYGRCIGWQWRGVERRI